MFYSQLLLSKKGALGIVWLAAHCHKRLKKDQVQQTDISSSVDKILDDEVPMVTHRILAFLLLGVVRIYSKKVEYLFQDCHEVMNKLYGLKTTKSKRAGIVVSRTRYYSITLPKRFELDAFDLEHLEDHQDLVGGNVILRKQDMLADGRKSPGSKSVVPLKEKMPFSEEYTPPRDMFSSHHINQGLFAGSSSNMNNISSSGVEVVRESSFSPEDRLDPIAWVEDGDIQMHDKVTSENVKTDLQEPINKSNLVPSLEKVRGTAFSYLEDRLDPMILDEVEKEQVINDRPSDDNINSKFCGQVQDAEFGSAANKSPQGSDLVASLGLLHKSSLTRQHSPSFKMLNKPSDKGHEVEVEHVDQLRNRVNFQEDEPCDFTESADKVQVMCSKKLKRLEVASSGSVKCQIREKTPISVVVTPISKLPEVATVRTPATKERAKILIKKRKILFDSTTAVSNKVFKSWIDDPSDLKRERRDVPRTLLHAWRTRKLGHLPQSIFEPVASVDLGDLECKESNVTATQVPAGQDSIVVKPSPVVESSVGQDDVVVRSPVAHVDYEQIGDIRSPVAPGTPVAHSKSVRSHEAGAVADDDSNILEPSTSSSESFDEKRSSLSQDFKFTEGTYSFEGDGREKGTYSERTRKMESYLGKKFLEKKKQREEQVLNLSQLLAGNTKKESARLFYEILVLKTHDCIDVEQEDAYDDILVWETHKLKQAS
ncbi:hypothetical protein OROGR_006749 [Orobanche gracilis]